ncbi:hypothetical protein CF326_g5725 [Tilletia indica]|nr:hypothetical protein CF326_g5725 [Tilletia indica]
MNRAPRATRIPLASRLAVRLATGQQSPAPENHTDDRNEGLQDDADGDQDHAFEFESSILPAVYDAGAGSSSRKRTRIRRKDSNSRSRSRSVSVSGPGNAEPELWQGFPLKVKSQPRVLVPPTLPPPPYAPDGLHAPIRRADAHVAIDRNFDELRRIHPEIFDQLTHEVLVSALEEQEVNYLEDRIRLQMAGELGPEGVEELRESVLEGGTTLTATWDEEGEAVLLLTAGGKDMSQLYLHEVRRVPQYGLVRTVYEQPLYSGPEQILQVTTCSRPDITSSDAPILLTVIRTASATHVWEIWRRPNQEDGHHHKRKMSLQNLPEPGPQPFLMTLVQEIPTYPDLRNEKVRSAGVSSASSGSNHDRKGKQKARPKEEIDENADDATLRGRAKPLSVPTIANVAWHPTDPNRLLTVDAVGRVGLWVYDPGPGTFHHRLIGNAPCPDTFYPLAPGSNLSASDAAYFQVQWSRKGLVAFLFSRLCFSAVSLETGFSVTISDLAIAPRIDSIVTRPHFIRALCSSADTLNRRNVVSSNWKTRELLAVLTTVDLFIWDVTSLERYVIEAESAHYQSTAAPLPLPPQAQVWWEHSRGLDRSLALSWVPVLGKSSHRSIVLSSARSRALMVYTFQLAQFPEQSPPEDPRTDLDDEGGIDGDDGGEADIEGQFQDDGEGQREGEGEGRREGEGEGVAEGEGEGEAEDEGEGEREDGEEGEGEGEGEEGDDDLNSEPCSFLAWPPTLLPPGLPSLAASQVKRPAGPLPFPRTNNPPLFIRFDPPDDYTGAAWPKPKEPKQMLMLEQDARASLWATVFELVPNPYGDANDVFAEEEPIKLGKYKVMPTNVRVVDDNLYFSDVPWHRNGEVYGNGFEKLLAVNSERPPVERDDQRDRGIVDLRLLYRALMQVGIIPQQDRIVQAEDVLTEATKQIRASELMSSTPQLPQAFLQRAQQSLEIDVIVLKIASAALGGTMLTPANMLSTDPHSRKMLKAFLAAMTSEMYISRPFRPEWHVGTSWPDNEEGGGRPLTVRAWEHLADDLRDIYLGPKRKKLPPTLLLGLAADQVALDLLLSSAAVSSRQVSVVMADPRQDVSAGEDVDEELSDRSGVEAVLYQITKSAGHPRERINDSDDEADDGGPSQRHRRASSHASGRSSRIGDLEDKIDKHLDEVERRFLPKVDMPFLAPRLRVESKMGKANAAELPISQAARLLLSDWTIGEKVEILHKYRNPYETVPDLDELERVRRNRRATSSQPPQSLRTPSRGQTPVNHVERWRNSTSTSALAAGSRASSPGGSQPSQPHSMGVPPTVGFAPPRIASRPSFAFASQLPEGGASFGGGWGSQLGQQSQDVVSGSSMPLGSGSHTGPMVGSSQDAEVAMASTQPLPGRYADRTAVPSKKKAKKRRAGGF